VPKEIFYVNSEILLQLVQM